MTEYLDLVDNAYSMLKEYFTFEDLYWMPIKNLLYWIHYFRPKFEKIARRQENERLKMELEGKRQNKLNGLNGPNNAGRRGR